MQSVVYILAALAVSSHVSGDEECMPPKPGTSGPPSPCCNFDKIMPANLKTIAQKCMGSVPSPPKPSGPLPTGGMPPKEMKDHEACFAQCMFGENKLLTDDKMINEPAVKTYFTVTDKEFIPVVQSALNKCLTSYKNDIDKSLNCTSGALELETCALREVFSHCPSSAWTSSNECNELKTKVTNCPKIPMKALMGPHN